jgi:rRNA maturation protein Nop10
MSKKPKGIQEYAPSPVSEIPTKQYRPSDFDLEQMYQEYRRGKTLTSIAEKFNLSDKTVGKYRKELKWDERRSKELEEKQKLERSEIEDIAKETYAKLLKVTYKLVSDFERYVFDGEEQGSPVPLKILTEAVEKLTKLHYFAANGGVERTKSETVTRNVTEKIDYAALAKIHLETKKLNPDYDQKALIKDVVNATYNKKSQS